MCLEMKTVTEQQAGEKFIGSCSPQKGGRGNAQSSDSGNEERRTGMIPWDETGRE